MLSSAASDFPAAVSAADNWSRVTPVPVSVMYRMSLEAASPAAVRPVESVKLTHATDFSIGLKPVIFKWVRLAREKFEAPLRFAPVIPVTRSSTAKERFVPDGSQPAMLTPERLVAERLSNELKSEPTSPVELEKSAS